jgi:hypothetical protein
MRGALATRMRALDQDALTPGWRRREALQVTGLPEPDR